jgi:Fic family protein
MTKTHPANRLAPVPNRPGLFALVPVELPRRLVLADSLVALEDAALATGALQALWRNAPFRDNLTHVESRVDAAALGLSASVRADLLKLLIFETSDDRSAPGRDIRLAVNCANAFDHGLREVREKGRNALTLALLSEMHRLLCNGLTLSGTPGEFRVRSSWTGTHRMGSRIVSPPGDQLEPALQDLERFLQDPPAMPLAIRLALVCGQIETLTPFEYGSSLLAWLMMPLMALAEGQPPVFLASVLNGRRQQYDDSLVDMQFNGQWDGWLRFFLDSVSVAAGGAGARLERVQQLRSDWDGKLAILRSDSTARRLAELAVGRPVLTVNAAQEMLRVSFQTANAAVAALVRLGIVAGYANMRRNRIFVVRETLAMLGTEVADAEPLPMRPSPVHDGAGTVF